MCKYPNYIEINDNIKNINISDNTTADSSSKAKVGSRIKNNFKALGMRYCDSIKGGKEDRKMKTGEIFAAVFIGVFMSSFLFIE